MVVVNSGAPDLMPWSGTVPAIVQAWYPGAEAGNALASVLFGDFNPSGRLPVSFPKLETDQPALTPQQYPGIANQAQYSEGMYIGYRHFDRNQITPLFPFGFGLSYTTFRYSNLRVTGPAPGGPPLTRTGLGGPSATATFDVTNTGTRDGADVPQLYIGPPPASPVDEPLRQLEGFQRVQVAAGQTVQVSLPIQFRAVSYYNVAQHAWTPLPGCHEVQIGSSESDIRLRISGVDQALLPCGSAAAATTPISAGGAGTGRHALPLTATNGGAPTAIVLTGLLVLGVLLGVRVTARRQG
ncbi:MAG: glycoside hydrolase family 3 C-terminal domain-containing protein [Candidatus Dormibacteria bacterium]